MLQAGYAGQLGPSQRLSLPEVALPLNDSCLESLHHESPWHVTWGQQHRVQSLAARAQPAAVRAPTMG
jgi:hypothetical protein